MLYQHLSGRPTWRQSASMIPSLGSAVSRGLALGVQPTHRPHQMYGIAGGRGRCLLDQCTSGVLLAALQMALPVALHLAPAGQVAGTFYQVGALAIVAWCVIASMLRIPWLLNTTSTIKLCTRNGRFRSHAMETTYRSGGKGTTRMRCIHACHRLTRHGMSFVERVSTDHTAHTFVPARRLTNDPNAIAFP